ncbi:Cytochrome c oxidase assembly factor 3, mitochondrial [Cytospora mali]|uniref:Cytochrome c oxidase assembly factor 3 n=1 Tax=Cytospora mali TaxID=578113 RepID=A0A194VR55_CYTMA|nr:Cytochrome c oxidase assembly factor 3, mitochondrial [Valsa mali]
MAGIDHSSYYTRASSQSAALLRARRPYLVKNAITGLGVAGIAVGVCTSTPFLFHVHPGERKNTDPLADVYTITAVGQDEFEDVKVPDVPVQQAQEINAPKK